MHSATSHIDYSTKVLEIRDLNLSYFTRAGEMPVVIDFSLDVYKGETVGLVGESGCGKSTVAMAIMQYMGAGGGIKSGSINFNGCDLAGMSGEELRQLRGSAISMIYQEPFTALNPSMRVGEQLMEVPLAHEDVSEEQAYERAVAMLADVRLPDPRRMMAAYPHQLSGGQQQRIVIAMGLLSNPELLLLDEPTTALDVTVEAGIARLTRDLSRKFGTSQIYISHNLGLIRETCDRVFVMYSGEVVESGEIDTVFRAPRHPYTKGLFACTPLLTADKNTAPLKPIPGTLPLPFARPRGCNFGPRCHHFVETRCEVDVDVEVVTDSSDDHLVRCRRWQEIEHHVEVEPGPPQAALEPGERVLDVKAVQKYYELRDSSLGAMISGRRIHYVKANEALDFEARRGETVAIVGESGCGKSTFAKVLIGLETATGGEIRHEGREIQALPVAQREPQQIGSLQMVFQNPGDTLNPSHTIGAQISRVVKKFGVESDKSRIRERVMTLLDLVKLPRDFYSRRPGQLSGGQKQRVGIARAFAGNPSMVVADEPVSSLDVSVAAAVIELLMDIQREHKTTLLFISHDLGIVHYLADRIVVMYLGHVMEWGTTQEIFSPPYHPYTEALLAAVPVADPAVTRREILLEGRLPSMVNPPRGCPFETRCPRKIGEICEQEKPQAQTTAEGHVIACHIPIEELSQVEPVIKASSEASSTGS